MCEHCASDPECRHPVCSAKGSGCACSLQGPAQCPTCGHPCLDWWWGMGVVGAPDWVSDFLGGQGSESPGFERYPATRAQLLGAWKERMEDILSDSDATLDDPRWLETHLPEGTYRDPGEVFLAVNPVLAGPALDPSKWVARLPVTALAAGSRLQVPQGAAAILVDSNGQPLEVFPAGEHVLSATTAPKAAAASRRPAPGTARYSLAATPLFCYLGDLEGKVQHSARPPPVPPPMFSATVRFWIAEPSKLAATPAVKVLESSAPQPQQLLSSVVQTKLQGLDAPTLGDHGKLETLLRSWLTEAGLGVRSIAFDARGYGGMPPSFAAGPQGSAPGAVGGMPPGMPPGIPPEALARMPPEARAMFEARMKAAMAAHAAATARAGSGAGTPPSGGAPGPSNGLPPGLVLCPNCRRPNPMSFASCVACGRPLKGP